MKIMVGIDGSQTAEQAVNYVRRLLAEELAGGEHAVILAYIIRPPSGAGFAFHPYVNADVYKVFEEKAEATLEEAADGLAGLDAEIKLIHEVGEPAQELARLATEEGADLLVVGSRGVGGLRGLTLGSVSQRVTQIAPCPVLVVRSAQDEMALREAALEPTAEEASVAGDARQRTRDGRVEHRPRCNRCGVLLTAENTSQETGYCDPCRSVVEGEIRRHSGFGRADD